MNKLRLLQHYQHIDPATGKPGIPRTNREYAALLGVHESTLSKFYSGQEPVGIKALQGLARAFPQSRKAIGAALAVPEREEERIGV